MASTYTLILILIGLFAPIKSFHHRSLRQQHRCNLLHLQATAPTSSTDKSTADRIQFLLTQAVKLMKLDTMNEDRKASRENRGNDFVNNNNNNSTQSMNGLPQPLLPVKLKFSSSHQHTIILKDALAAHSYLSLPASEYSVLDSTMVSRDTGRDDTFILTLPLGDITAAAASFQTSKTNKIPKLMVSVSTSVTVKPDPKNGRVIMESGPIYFTPMSPTSPSPTITIKTATATASVTTSSTSSFSSSRSSSSSGATNTNVDTDAYTGANANTHTDDSFESTLPEWLIWGGEKETLTQGQLGSQDKLDDMQDLSVDSLDTITEKIETTSITTTRSSTSQSFLPTRASTPHEASETHKTEADIENKIWGGEDKNKDSVKDTQTSVPVKSKSSIQAGFKIILSWKPPSSSSLVSSSSSSSSTSSSSFSSSFSFKLPWSKEKTQRDVGVTLTENANLIPTSFPTQPSQDIVMNVNTTNSISTTTEVAQSIESIESSMNVNAKISVWVEMNLPIRRDVSRAISFPPVKLLLSQAGSLITKAVLKSLTPTLSDLLILDHDRRRKSS